MRKKILIGSIIAVIILTLVSFTSVVGFQKVRTSVRESPLFSIRAKRAIDEEQKITTCDYLGKGRVSGLSIPSRDSRMALVQKVIDRINRMNEEEFNRFIRLVIHYLDESHDTDTQEIIDPLHRLRDNPDEIKNYITREKERKYFTSEGCETVGFIWIPECWLYLVWLILSPFIWLILSLATVIFNCL